jgi:hypothetical protein
MERFKRFWDSYPRHTAQEAAETAFRSLDPDESLLAVMLQAIERQKKSGCLRPLTDRDGRSVVPYGSTWLNGKRWRDDEETNKEDPAKMTPEELAEWRKKESEDWKSRPWTPYA